MTTPDDDLTVAAILAAKDQGEAGMRDLAISMSETFKTLRRSGMSRENAEKMVYHLWVTMVNLFFATQIHELNHPTPKAD